MNCYGVNNDPHVVNYLNAMEDWMVSNSLFSREYIQSLFIENQHRIKNLFTSYSHVIFHDEPEKWVELLAESWGVIDEIKLEFVNTNTKEID